MAAALGPEFDRYGFRSELSGCGGNSSGVRHADHGQAVLPYPTTEAAVWGAPPADTVARFWSKVTRTATCWWWMGAGLFDLDPPLVP